MATLPLDEVLPRYNLDGFLKLFDDEKEKHIRGWKDKLYVNYCCNCIVYIHITHIHQHTNVTGLTDLAQVLAA